MNCFRSLLSLCGKGLAYVVAFAFLGLGGFFFSGLAVFLFTMLPSCHKPAVCRYSLRSPAGRNFKLQHPPTRPIVSA